MLFLTNIFTEISFNLSKSTFGFVNLILHRSFIDFCIHGSSSTLLLIILHFPSYILFYKNTIILLEPQIFINFISFPENWPNLSMYFRLKLLLRLCSSFSNIHISSKSYDYVYSMKISLQSEPRYSCKLYSYRKKCARVLVLNTNVLTKKVALWKGRTGNFSSN